MTYLITGAAGQLGSTFHRALSGRGTVHALTREDLDLTSEASVAAVVARLRPGVILNCAAYNAVDRAETEPVAALAVNAFAVQSLARAASACAATLVHYSTDFVFDGTASTPYMEEAPANPRSVYGQSKLVGEWMALEAPGAYVLRVESLFGGPAARSSIDKIIATLKAGAETRVFVDRVVTPSYVEDVVTATLALLERGAAPGLYHCVNSGATTWHDLAVEIARRLDITPRLIPVSVADVTLAAPRPQYCALSNVKLSEAGVPMPGWQDAVRRYLLI